MVVVYWFLLLSNSLDQSHVKIVSAEQKSSSSDSQTSVVRAAEIWQRQTFHVSVDESMDTVCERSFCVRKKGVSITVFANTAIASSY
jgi:hypothetical protein